MKTGEWSKHYWHGLLILYFCFHAIQKHIQGDLCFIKREKTRYRLVEILTGFVFKYTWKLKTSKSEKKENEKNAKEKIITVGNRDYTAGYIGIQYKTNDCIASHYEQCACCSRCSIRKGPAASHSAILGRRGLPGPRERWGRASAAAACNPRGILGFSEEQRGRKR